MCALKNVKEVELMGMPKLKKCVLMGGLKNVKSVKMENAGKLGFCTTTGINAASF